MRSNINEAPVEIENITALTEKLRYCMPGKADVYDKDFKHINLKFAPDYIAENQEADDILKTAADLSARLCKEFKLVRIDWMIYDNKLYFNEMIFTPFSGFYKFENEYWNKKSGSMLDLRRKQP